MLLLGIDLGTSSIKASVLDAASGKVLATTRYPDTERSVAAPHPGWAEQDPEQWWADVQAAIIQLHATGAYNPTDIGAIGIAYQMHGLVTIDKNQQVVRPAIIWCDSRAITIGEELVALLGEHYCLNHLLNSPGNFTASKLKWVQFHEPENYARIHRIMLPGDFIAMKLTGTVTTTSSALSEGIFWDFVHDNLSRPLMDLCAFDDHLIPTIQPLLSEHGYLATAVANQLSLKKGIPITYKAGDQPNNALSLNVLEPGEVAATAGTSGVIYGVTDRLHHDPLSRVNSFAHINHTPAEKRIGVLMCINGTGILKSWTNKMFGNSNNYATMNAKAASIAAGSEGVTIIPFGNGAERIFQNKTIGTQLQGIDLNRHGEAHIFRAVQEGIGYAFRYGLDIMRSNGIQPSVIRAGYANLFLSEVFTSIFVHTLQVPVELYANDGSVGAAIGAGMGAGVFEDQKAAFKGLQLKQVIEPTVEGSATYDRLYHGWKETLEKYL